LPRIGSSISKDDRAYTYLHESVQAFPEGDQFLEVMRKSGFDREYRLKLMNGIASIYVGKKY
jgi:demethylmenaquinone methyltransferase/2-methoxy-6-polyprenyl-1,4-benzoquinol methylase